MRGGIVKDTTKGARGGPRPGSGRKALPAHLKRSHRVMISVTEQDYRALKKASRPEGVSSYIYDLIRRSLSRRRK